MSSLMTGGTFLYLSLLLCVLSRAQDVDPRVLELEARLDAFQWNRSDCKPPGLFHAAYFNDYKARMAEVCYGLLWNHFLDVSATYSLIRQPVERLLVRIEATNREMADAKASKNLTTGLQWRLVALDAALIRNAEAEIAEMNCMSGMCDDVSGLLWSFFFFFFFFL